MKRQRIGSSLAVPTLARARPVLRSSTKLNQVPTPITEAMSYKELVKVVGVDPEASPSSWRKAIDHSAETVVFFQVDLRGSTPRMSKSVRICQEEENKQRRLVPSVFIGDSLLSATYVKTIIGQRFLSDEDDLMKLLEHAGILHEDEEFAEEIGEDRRSDDGDAGAGENEPFNPEPEPKRTKVAEKQLSGMDYSLSPTVSRCITRSNAAVCRKTVKPNLAASGGRQPVDLSPLLMFDKSDALPVSSISNVSLPVDDTPLLADLAVDGMPAAEDDDDTPLGYNAPGPSRMDDALDSPETRSQLKNGERVAEVETNRGDDQGNS